MTPPRERGGVMATREQRGGEGEGASGAPEPARADEDGPRGWSSPKVELRARGGQVGVFARAPIEAGELLVGLARVFVSRASQYTIQIDEHLHQAGTSELDDYFNHCCDPNCRLDFDQLAFVALRPIAPGEQLSFNYLTTEWSLDAPFTCWCERPSARCVHEIRGFRYLSRERQLALQPLLSPFLRRRLAVMLERDTDPHPPDPEEPTDA